MCNSCLDAQACHSRDSARRTLPVPALNGERVEPAPAKARGEGRQDEGNVGRNSFAPCTWAKRIAPHGSKRRRKITVQYDPSEVRVYCTLQVSFFIADYDDRGRSATRIATRGTIIHCRTGMRPVPMIGSTGMRLEYVQLPRTLTLSHSLKIVYAMPKTSVAAITGRARSSGHRSVPKSSRARSSTNAAIMTSPAEQWTTAKAISRHVPLRQIV